MLAIIFMRIKVNYFEIGCFFFRKKICEVLPLFKENIAFGFYSSFVNI